MPFEPFELRAIEDWGEKNKISLTPLMLDRLGIFRYLLVSWSDRMNLVSRSDIPRILTNHILDSLGSASMIPPGSRVIDIGSGAGLPGIPLAIVRDDITITLLESIHKKIVFLKAALDELELKNVSILEKRLESMERIRAYDVATIRALPRLESQIERIQALIRPGGMIIYYEKRGVYRGIHV
jgi:16S rRNA (guanine527-N7)-methyltransferase